MSILVEKEEGGADGTACGMVQVILEHYRVKHGESLRLHCSFLKITNANVAHGLELKRSHVLFYKPYKPLSSPSFPPPSPLSPSSSPPSSSSSSQPGETHLQEIERLIEAGEFLQSRRKSAELIELALEGIRYLETCVDCFIFFFLFCFSSFLRQTVHDFFSTSDYTRFLSARDTPNVNF